MRSTLHRYRGQFVKAEIMKTLKVEAVSMSFSRMAIARSCH